MTKRLLALVAVVSATLIAQSTQDEAARMPVGIVTKIAAGDSGARPEILRAGSALEIGVRSGELLFAGDKISSRDSTISFAFCANKLKKALMPSGAVEFSDTELRVLEGQLTDQGAARFCRLPDLSGLPAANSQHYGGALTRSLATETRRHSSRKLPRCRPRDGRNSSPNSDPSMKPSRPSLRMWKRGSLALLFWLNSD